MYFFSATEIIFGICRQTTTFADINVLGDMSKFIGR